MTDSFCFYSVALPKMSRSRSGSRSPAPEPSSVNRKLVLTSPGDDIDQSDGPLQMLGNQFVDASKWRPFLFKIKFPYLVCILRLPIPLLAYFY